MPSSRFLLFSFTLVVSLVSRAEGVPQTTVESLKFAGNKIGLVVVHMDSGNSDVERYLFELDPEIMKAIPVSETDYRARYDSSFKMERTQKSTPFDWKNWPLMASDGTVFKEERLNCTPQEEGDPECKRLSLESGSKKAILQVEDLCTLSCFVRSIENWNHQIWAGLYIHGELQPYGKGLVVFDPNYKILFRRKSDPNEKDLLPTLLQKDPNKSRMWIGSDLGLFAFNQKFEETARCSYEIKSDGKPKLQLKCLKK